MPFLIIIIIFVVCGFVEISTTKMNHLTRKLSKKSIGRVAGLFLSKSLKESVNLTYSFVPNLSRKSFLSNYPDQSDIDFKKSFIEWNEENERVIELLHLYFQEFGECYVAPSFVIPPKSPWPVESHGYTLGKFCRTLRKIGKERLKTRNPYFYNKLEDLNFVWASKAYKSKKMLGAYKAYKEIFGNVDVPHWFRVPKEDPTWPKRFWGLRLGKILINIRWPKVPYYHDIKPQLRLLGFDFEPRRTTPCEFSTLKDALQIFHTIHDHYRVPSKFVIDSEKDTLFPASMNGLDLGRIVHDIQHNGAYNSNAKELEEIGFQINSNRQKKFMAILDALKVYKELHGKDFKNLPISFVVPENDTNYPKHTWGIKLGDIYSRMRRKNAYSKYKKLVMELGFDL